MTEQRLPWQAKFVALALIWGSSFLLIKLAIASFDPVQVGAARIVLGAAVLLAIVTGRRIRLPRSRRVWLHLQVTSLFLATIPFLLFPLGEQRVSSALAGIGNATTPLATVVATLLMLPRERLPARKLVAVVIGFLGVVVISEPWAAGRPDLLGFGMTVVAGACYGVGWTYIKRFLSSGDIGGLALPAAQLMAASAQMALVTVVWWWWHRETLPTPWAPAHPGEVLPALLALVVLGVVGTGLAYAMQFDVFRAIGQQVSSTVTYLIPVVAVLLGVLVLGEHLGWAQLAGFAIVLSCAVVIGLPDRRGVAA